jgi:DHA1 family multidrug resistance protein-like MFS transporter
MLATFGFTLFTPFLPLFVQTLGISDPAQAKLWAGLVTSIYMVGATVATPIWSGLSDRYGRRVMLLRATCTAVVIISLMGAVTTPWQLLILRLLQGLGAVVNPLVTVLASSIVAREQMGFSLGLIQGSVYLGSTFAPPLGGMIADRWGYRPAAFLGAGVLAITSILVLVGVRERFVRPLPPQRTGPRRPLDALRALSSDRSLLKLAVIFMLVRLAQALPQPLVPLFVQELSDVPERLATVAGGILSAAALAGALAAVGVGRLADRFGHRRVLLYSSLAAAAFGFAQVFARDNLQFGLLQFGSGLFVAAATLAVNALVANRAHQGHEGTDFGVVFGVSFVGWTIGPVIGSAVAAAWAMRAVFGISAALFLLATLWTARSGEQMGIRDRAQ